MDCQKLVTDGTTRVPSVTIFTNNRFLENITYLLTFSPILFMFASLQAGSKDPAIHQLATCRILYEIYSNVHQLATCWIHSNQSRDSIQQVASWRVAGSWYDEYIEPAWRLHLLMLVPFYSSSIRSVAVSSKSYYDLPIKSLLGQGTNKNLFFLYYFSLQPVIKRHVLLRLA